MCAPSLKLSHLIYVQISVAIDIQGAPLYKAKQCMCFLHVRQKTGHRVTSCSIAVRVGITRAAAIK